MSFKWWCAIAGGLFLLGIILGLTVTGGVAGLLTEDIARLQQLAASLGPFKISTAIFIFLKNVLALFLSFILSPILCLMPLLSLTLNGWLLSYVSAVAVQQKSLGFVLAAILPHGILEIPALIMGEAAALSFGVMVMTALIFPRKRGQLLPNLRQNLRYLTIAVILLVPASIIETFITPLLVS